MTLLVITGRKTRTIYTLNCNLKRHELSEPKQTALASIRTDTTIIIHTNNLGFDGAFRGILSLIPATAINIQNKTTENNNKKVCKYNVQWAAQQALEAVLYKVT